MGDPYLHVEHIQIVQTLNYIYRLRHCRRPHESEYSVIVLLAVWLCVRVCVCVCVCVCLSVCLVD